MAVTTRYLNRDLLTGNNDGTTEADAWRAWSNVTWVNGLHLHVKTAVYVETAQFSLPVLIAAEQIEPIIVEGYETVPGDGNFAVVECGDNRIYNFQIVGIHWKNLDIRRDGGTNAFTSSGVVATVSNCKFKITKDSTEFNAVFQEVLVSNCYFESDMPGSECAFFKYCSVVDCEFVNTGGGAGANFNLSFADNLFNNNIIRTTGITGTIGLEITEADNNDVNMIANNTIDGYTDAIVIPELGTFTDATKPLFIGNIISRCTHGYLNLQESTKAHSSWIIDPIFYETDAHFLNFTGHSDHFTNTQILQRDPFESIGTDYSISSTAETLMQESFGSGILTNTINRTVGPTRTAEVSSVPEIIPVDLATLSLTQLISDIIADEAVPIDLAALVLTQQISVINASEICFVDTATLTLSQLESVINAVIICPVDTATLTLSQLESVIMQL